jgi:hypothetical protein
MFDSVPLFDGSLTEQGVLGEWKLIPYEMWRCPVVREEDKECSMI